ncbi:MAG TPA: tyrosine-type recombinase/integrase [Candidatus Saccharimonadia bacterium]|nr:tyrosine-type recombinase/integrase [Candidatus Saccharimonadia bacterium]
MTMLPKYLTQDELHRFFNVITSPRDRAMFALIYHYGLRVDEAATLTVEDIDFKNHRIRIRRLKNGIGGEKPVWRHTAKLLRASLRVRRDVTPYLFTGRQGALQKRQIQNLFNNYAYAAGLTTRNIHTLRHSIAVHLREAGRGIAYGADHLGHRNIRNTRVYAQITNPLRAQVFRELEPHPKMVRV